MDCVAPLTILETASSVLLIPKSCACEFPVPAGIKPNRIVELSFDCIIQPVILSERLPSPPTTAMA